MDNVTRRTATYNRESTVRKDTQGYYDFAEYESLQIVPRRRKRPLTRKEKCVKKLKKWYNKHMPRIIIVSIITAMLVIPCIITIKFMNFKASNEMRDFGRTKYYTTYTVQAGDTLWSIASEMVKYNPEYPDIRMYITEVQRLNHVYDNIKYGGKITLPYYMYDGDDADDIVRKYGLKLTPSGQEGR